jgi:N-acetylglutamate synthase-like GNAT family acetyltransferase
MIQTMPDLRIRHASKNDLPKIIELLDTLHLPTEGVSSHIEHFLISESQGEVIGTIGLEIYDKTALLRSAAVVAKYQNKGIGNRLYNVLQSYAQQIGVREFVLLTTTAKDYFIGKGFEIIERESINKGVLDSAEFKGACPATTIMMRKMIL